MVEDSWTNSHFKPAGEVTVGYLLGQSAGLPGRELLLVEVSENTAQYGVML